MLVTFSVTYVSNVTTHFSTLSDFLYFQKCSVFQIEARQKKAHKVRSNMKVLLTYKGIVYYEFSLSGHTLSKEYYL